MNKSIWIDLDNSPHVPLFAPIIRHYRGVGVEVVLTARDHSQTLELLAIKGFAGPFAVIGRHSGKGKLGKILGTLRRARELARHVKDKNIDVAVSHGSRSIVLAAWWLGIPVVTMYDYEHTETGIFNRFSTRVLVPDGIPDAVLDEIGLAAEKRRKYQGIKEELYIRDFESEPDFRERFFHENGRNDSVEKILITLRPPATTANYHAEASDDLFRELLRFLTDSPNVFTVIVPRTAEQAALIEREIGPEENSSFLVLRDAVDGLQLAYASDLLISGGGTMNREAALLGVPVYSIFAGRLGSLDAAMERDGLITFIRDKSDLEKLKIEPRDRTPQPRPRLTDRVERFVIDQIDAFLR